MAEESIKKSKVFPTKTLLLPPLSLIFIYLFMMTLPMAKDIHSGGALMAIGVILLTGVIGFIVELVAVPKAFMKIKRNKELMLGRNYLVLLIGAIYVIFILASSIYLIVSLSKSSSV